MESVVPMQIISINKQNQYRRRHFTGFTINYTFEQVFWSALLQIYMTIALFECNFAHHKRTEAGTLNVLFYLMLLRYWPWLWSVMIDASPSYRFKVNSVPSCRLVDTLFGNG